MKRRPLNNTYLKRRINAVHSRAKFAGVFYLLGTLALSAVIVLTTLVDNTCLGTAAFPTFAMPVLTFYQPFITLFANLQSLSAEILIDATVAALYAILLLVLLCNILGSFAKLRWLFKRRASYIHGFNRNMYAMDAIGKRFASSFAAAIILYLQIYLLTDGAALNTFSYAFLAVGGFFHILCGLIGGNATLFTKGETTQEEPREFGVFVFFIRNLIQIAAVGGIIYFLIPQSAVVPAVLEVMQKVVFEQNTEWLTANLMSLIPAIAELVAWLCIVVLIKHATAPTEYNRDGMDGAGMNNFAVFSFLAAACLAAIVILPMAQITPALSQEASTAFILSAVIAFVAFVLDLIVRPRYHDDPDDDPDMEAYLQGNNQTIV